MYECCLAVCALQQVTGQMHRLEFVYSQTADFLLGVRLVRVMILRRKKRLWRLRTGIATKQEMSEGLRDILYTWASCQTKDLFFFNKKVISLILFMFTWYFQFITVHFTDHSVVSMYGGTVSSCILIANINSDFQKSN